MKLITLFLSVVVLLSGCSLLEPAADEIAEGVNAYCEQPLEVRRTVRAQVNAATEPNLIVVYCDGDPGPSL